VARLDRMEGPVKTCPLDDSTPLMEDPAQLRRRADRDGFLFVRGLLPQDAVLALRRAVLDYAGNAGWLAPGVGADEGRAAPGKRVGFYQDPDWVNLQAHVQNCPEMWVLGDAIAIHRVLNATEKRSSYLCLSTANTCRIFSPHPDMATRPHQDGHYVQMLGDFWTAWIPLGDCPRELGPLALHAGSHHGGLREHAGQGIVDGGIAMPDDTVWSTADFRCGDAVLFRARTVHCSLPNRSGDRLRVSVDFRYGFWSEEAAVDWRAAANGT
jgi:ectoine hydroxylase-related dioxygenase (phytanoyl-CoA dioxygenase family)